MGPGIIIPVIALVVVVPVGFTWARRLRDGANVSAADGGPGASGARLTSAALRDLPAPPWRVVYEIAGDKLGGIEHVLIGPAGVFWMVTRMDPMPDGPAAEQEPPSYTRGAAAVAAGIATVHDKKPIGVEPVQGEGQRDQVKEKESISQEGGYRPHDASW